MDTKTSSPRAASLCYMSLSKNINPSHARIQEFPSGWGGGGGGGVQVILKKKAPTTFYFFLIILFSPQLVNFKENYHFSRFQRGSNISRGGGGVQHFPGWRGGSNCLFPIEIHITCDFPGSPDPLSPTLDPHLLAWYWFNPGRPVPL